MTTETPGAGLTDAERAERELRKRLQWIIDAPAGNRCITCSHVKHNELGYCQVGQCACGDGSTFAGTASIILRDLPDLVAARAEPAPSGAEAALTDQLNAAMLRNIGLRRQSDAAEAALERVRALASDWKVFLEDESDSATIPLEDALSAIRAALAPSAGPDEAGGSDE